MPFEYVEDAATSDVTFHAWAGSLDELFAAAAAAVTNVMVADLSTVRALTHRAVSVNAGALDLLLLRLLEELIFLKDSEGLLLLAEQVSVDTAARSQQCARATLAGERIDRRRHELVADVKAVTLHGLRVEQVGGLWHAHVTLDV
jgi:SHS2 domain-containing protein